MPFWIEEPMDSETGYNIDSAIRYRVMRRDDAGQVSRIDVMWSDRIGTYDGFLARQVYARITANLMKAADEPKEGGRS